MIVGGPAAPYDTHVKPFVLIATRPENGVADAEYEQFRRAGGLQPEELVRIRLEQAPMPELDLDAVSGIILAGSPFTTSDSQDTKSPLQLRVESELAHLLDRVIEADLPLMGACYGVGTLGIHQGADVDRTYGEEASDIQVTLTPEAATDPLVDAAELPPVFTAIVGHKEAVRRLPEHAVLLGRGEACPVQMFRIGTRQYATQFHPELDPAGLMERLEVYRHSGYIDPADIDALAERVRTIDVSAAERVLRGFTRLFAR